MTVVNPDSRASNTLASLLDEDQETAVCAKSNGHIEFDFLTPVTLDALQFRQARIDPSYLEEREIHVRNASDNTW
jgi:hypothetical protein